MRQKEGTVKAQRPSVATIPPAPTKTVMPTTVGADPEKLKTAYDQYKKAYGGGLGQKGGDHKTDRKIVRVPSGIPGFDDLVEGGFKKGSTVLVTGGPGSGKTTFLLQYLYEGARKGEAGLFISFEEREDEILDDFSGYTWELEEMFEKKKIFFLNYPPHQVEKIMEQGGGMIKDMIKDANITRIGIDSLTSFSMLFKDEYEKRENVLKLFNILEGWKCTTLLTAEKVPSLEEAESDFGLEFLVDGAVILYNVRHGNVREQAVEVLKMRATNVKKKICPITITKEGLQVFPDAEVFTEI